MILRLIQILIVIGWLSSTFVLIRRTYFPDEARYPVADVGDVAGLFFGQGKSMDLAILKGGRQFGRMNVNPRDVPARPPKQLQDVSEVREIFFSGFLTGNPQPEDSPFGQMAWNGSLFVDRDFRLVALRLGGRIPRLATGEIVLAVDPPDLIYEIRQGREILLSSKEPQKTRDTLKQLGELMGDAPVDLGILDGSVEQLGSFLALIQPKVECRHGQFQIFGDRYHGFILSLTFVDEWKLRLYLSELGELLKIDGIPDLLILGEAFVPQEMVETE